MVIQFNSNQPALPQMIPQISSLTPLTTAVPLIVVLAVTAIKDAIDDIVSFLRIIWLQVFRSSSSKTRNFQMMNPDSSLATTSQ